MFHKYFNLIFLPSIKTTSAHKVDDIINNFLRKLKALYETLSQSLNISDDNHSYKALHISLYIVCSCKILIIMHVFEGFVGAGAVFDCLLLWLNIYVICFTSTL